MTTTTQLQAYLTGIYDDYEGSWAEPELVIAESPEAAARLAYPGFDDERIAEVLSGDDDYTIERCEAGDALIGDEGPRLIRSWESLRSIGFHNEDESHCDGCDEYREGVCSGCNCCFDCRDPECEECDPNRCGECGDLPGDCECGPKDLATCGGDPC